MRLVSTMLVLLVPPGAAQAAVTLTTSRASVGVTNYIDWGQLGPLSRGLTSPLAVTSTGGNHAAVTSKGGIFGTRRQSSAYWHGNFTFGDLLLWTQPQGGPDITLTFSQPVAATGAQIQPDNFGAFVAHISAYNAKGALLGRISEAGTSNGQQGSAIFIGVMSKIADIQRIVFTVSGIGNPNDFAINRVALAGATTAASLTPRSVATVPEPAGWTLMIAGFGLIGGAARYRRATASRQPIA